MNATTKHLLTAVATALFAIAATATTVTNAFAQTEPAKQPTKQEQVAAGKSAQPAGLTREQVQKEFLEARKNGTLIETEADMDVAQTRKHHAK